MRRSNTFVVVTILLFVSGCSASHYRPADNEANGAGGSRGIEDSATAGSDPENRDASSSLESRDSSMDEYDPDHEEAADTGPSTALDGGGRLDAEQEYVPDAGSVSDADGSDATIANCGLVSCLPGQVCCNASCSICALPNDICYEKTCGVGIGPDPDTICHPNEGCISYPMPVEAMCEDGSIAVEYEGWCERDSDGSCSRVYLYSCP